MRAANATTGRSPSDSNPATIRMYAALAAAGFRRYATYRQAMVAAAVTNSAFGFLRCYAILAAVAGAGGVAAGYGTDHLVTYVWAGQGLIGTIMLWAPADLAGRIRSGDVVSDLLRPVDPIWRELAGDVGRAGYGALTRFVVPMVVGALTFDLYAPRRPWTYPLFAVSVLLASVVCFACRYLVNVSAYWLLDVRGPTMAWLIFSTTFSGLAFPLRFLPEWAYLTLYCATPMPSLVQIPLDLLVERDRPATRLLLLAVQAGWAAIMLAICRAVQRRAEFRLVVQGG